MACAAWAEAPEATAQPVRATPAGHALHAGKRPPRLSAERVPAEAPERGLIPVAGLLIHPYASDESFGAGFQVGVRHGFASLMFRENFSRSTQHAEDGQLLRLKSRVSFELSLEAQARIRQFRPYAGVGGLLRRDIWEWTRLDEQRFVSDTERELVPRPFVVAGLIGSVVEANVLLVLQDEPELRFGLGFVVGR
jgi:hypothetical protein